MGGPAPVEGVFEQAQAARAAGRDAEALRLFWDAIAQARVAGDQETWARAALGAAALQRFGPDPGRLPALLAEALAAQDDPGPKARLAAALARAWAYAGHADRATPYAQQALDLAREQSDPVILADALDTALTTRWGPDDLPSRIALTAELDDVAAHLPDPEARLQAHLWGLTLAFERLDVLQVNRHAHALDLVGEESPKARFFAASRRLAVELQRGRTDMAPLLIDAARDAASEASVPDAEVVLQAMDAYAALHAGDPEGCARSAVVAETIADEQGIVTLAAEAAPFWVAAGRLDRASALIRRFEGHVLAELPRDHDWLLVMQCVLDAALATGQLDTVAQVVALLSPYEGRGVVNGGAFMFHGVTDDPLSRARLVLGDHEAAAALRRSALAEYERLGAHWWTRRLLASAEGRDATPARPAQTVDAVFRQVPGGDWEIGRRSVPVRLPPLRGLAYLEVLLSRPGREVSAVSLVESVSRRPAVIQAGLGPVLDDVARRAYRARLQELDAELDEAESWADLGRAERLRQDRDRLMEELRSAFDVHGVGRVPGSTVERARVAVRKAVVAALDHLARLDPVTARHLRAHIRTGAECMYDPDPDAPWVWHLA